MLSADEKKSLNDLLNQVLPPHADALVSARTKLGAGDDNLTQSECDGLTFVLSAVQYGGSETEVLAQMQRVGDLRAKLQGKPIKAPAQKKSKVEKKPVVKTAPGGLS